MKQLEITEGGARGSKLPDVRNIRGRFGLCQRPKARHHCRVGKIVLRTRVDASEEGRHTTPPARYIHIPGVEDRQSSRPSQQILPVLQDRAQNRDDHEVAWKGVPAPQQDPTVENQRASPQPGRGSGASGVDSRGVAWTASSCQYCHLAPNKLPSHLLTTRPMAEKCSTSSWTRDEGSGSARI